MTRPGFAIVGVCRRSPPGLKPHAHRGEDAGLRARGLWCFERLIWIGHRDGPPGEPRTPTSAPSCPARRSLVRSSPVTSRLMPGERTLPRRDRSPRRRREAPGQNWPFRLVRFSVRTRGREIPLLVQGFECGLGALWPPVLRQRAGSTPSSAPPTATGLRGLTGSRAACRTRQFAAKRPSSPRPDGPGRGRG
jgi:hypothetical protein